MPRIKEIWVFLFGILIPLLFFQFYFGNSGIKSELSMNRRHLKSIESIIEHMNLNNEVKHLLEDYQVDKHGIPKKTLVSLVI